MSHGGRPGSLLSLGDEPNPGRRHRVPREWSALRHGDDGAGLELWSFEESPYCRIVCEVLCELTLPYQLHNLGKRSTARPAFQAMTGRRMVPHLRHPNARAATFESAEIVAYLEKTYAL